MAAEHPPTSGTGSGSLTTRSGRVKAARRLTRRAVRQGHRLFLAEGAKALGEALAVPGCVVEVFATAEASASCAPLRDAVVQAGLRWQYADEPAVASLSGTVTPQGVVAVCRYVDVALETLLHADDSGDPDPDGTGPRTIAICADVRDPGNAGTIIRTADAAGARAVVLAGHSVDPYNDKTVRATVGSLFHLPLVVEAEPTSAVRALQGAGWTVLAADGHGEADLFDAGDLLDGRVAWLFGNEAWGLPPELAALADHRVAIPILGRAESLNLATAAAVCLYASAAAARAAGR
ncbi:TrmH family RNA methyltransferase [Nocardioides terrisoli]|uniref:TrmH family RNA methyltransferase n=1 Tax=Nocardioides terrisoli TaxID=3388267 RepID=UPI00287BC490|nr:RNA methyltransferase [Nocardioides marmorisolisilvae]